MNPGKEFVNAIMSVLRLEQNVYVTASIEEIIDRIDMRDYTIFIAYLGERSGDFERPIQTIAKAVDEFYEKKNKPKRIAILEVVEQIERAFMNSESRAIDLKRVKKYEDDGEWAGKYTVSKKEVATEMLDIDPKEKPDFHVKDKTLPYSSLKPLINKCGGLESLISIYLEDRAEFKKLLIENSDVRNYQKLSILEKIDRDAKEDINNNVLKLINKKLVPQQVTW
ncbi:MAG: hypothetical protein E3J43_09935 [Candidatus Heimdallarchaeota archaeon]|nr:MAG: hypothetical protein E3J43_09935 [Candidatus Heimdallarchaeota archaeon]